MMVKKKDIEKLLNYMWHDEKRSWEESEKPRNHIFVLMKKIKRDLKLKKVGL